MDIDYLVVGSGLTGAVIARTLSDMGFRVLVLERRGHVGGNVHDHFHESGIRIHTYGPHYFRTNSEKIWNFVNRFSSFYNYEASLLSEVDGELAHWPVTSEYIKKSLGGSWEPSFKGEPANFEEASLSMMPEQIYQKFVKGYTEKQWGVPAVSLSKSLAGRFEVEEGTDYRLKKHQYQGIPTDGYAVLMEKMLEGIPVLLHFDFLKNREAFKPKKLLIYTGSIDDYFGCDLGKLKYRGQKRIHEYHPTQDFLQPCGQVNNPDSNSAPHVRTLEWKHMMKEEFANKIEGTVLTREVPFTPSCSSEYEYPFPDSDNRELYQKYSDRAKLLPNVLICGRLGEYRYYDMDQAIARALTLVERIKVSQSLAQALNEVEDLAKQQEDLQELKSEVVSEKEILSVP